MLEEAEALRHKMPSFLSPYTYGGVWSQVSYPSFFNFESVNSYVLYFDNELTIFFHNSVILQSNLLNKDKKLGVWFIY